MKWNVPHRLKNILVWKKIVVQNVLTWSHTTVLINYAKNVLGSRVFFMGGNRGQGVKFEEHCVWISHSDERLTILIDNFTVGQEIKSQIFKRLLSYQISH